MDNAIINMNLTPQEALIIENIRSMQGKAEPVRQSDESREGSCTDCVKKDKTWPDWKQLTQNYYGMSTEEFMEHYTDCMGDDIVQDFLSVNLSVEDKLNAIIDCIDDDVVDHLFDTYVTKEVKNSMFYERNDIATLTEQLVDMIMDGDWTPKN